MLQVNFPVMVLANVLFWAGKMFITLPRMGQVKSELDAENAC